MSVYKIKIIVLHFSSRPSTFLSFFCVKPLPVFGKPKDADCTHLLFQAMWYPVPLHRTSLKLPHSCQTNIFTKELVVTKPNTVATIGLP